MEKNTGIKENKVSIITACYNSEKLVELTLKSVLSQTYKNWEMILINDCSNDDTLCIINGYAAMDNRIKIISLKTNLGIAGARNAGINVATGDYICFLDSDDLWDDNKLDTQVSFMAKENLEISHTAYRKIDFEGNIISKKISVSKKIGYKQLLKHNEMGCLTVMYDVRLLGKRYFIKTGHEDFVYWLDILKTDVYSYGIDIILSSYRVHANTTSSNKLKAASFTWNIYRNIEGFSFLKSAYYFSHYSTKSLIKFLNK